MSKNDWIAYGLVGLGVIIIVAYNFLIPAEDRKQLWTKLTNRPLWNRFLSECRSECKTTDLSCVAPCMEDAVMTGYTTHKKKVPWGGGTQQTPAGTRYLAGPNDLPAVT